MKIILHKAMRVTMGVALLLFWAGVLEAQVFPGDANLSGRVDQQDILYIGYAYGSSGPARIESGTEFMEMPIALPWAQEFPNEVNYAHADANGSGQVDITDMLTVVSNYGLIHNTPSEPEYPIPNPASDPQLRLMPGSIPEPLTAGSTVDIAIELDYPGLPADNINGLAFSIDFEKSYIQSITLGYATNWLGGNSNSFRFQTIDPQQTDQLDLASTRYGANGTTAQGAVGLLSLVIEDDLITFMESDSAIILISLDKIMLVDESLELQPVNGDTVKLIIYNPRFLLTTERSEEQQPFQCFPNPVINRQLYLSAPERLEEARIYNLVGKEMMRITGSGTREWTIEIPYNWPSAYYLLKARTQSGRINEQLLFIP